MFRRYLLVVVTIGCTASAHAQASQAPAPPQASPTATLTVTSRLVVLDVVVTDAKGHPVPGLTKNDFTLLQDGVVQPIRNFEGWSANAPTPATDGKAGFDVRTSPLTIFVLDELNTPFAEQSYAAFTLKRYLQSQPAVLPTPATLLTVSDHGLQTLADYTRDRDALLRALDKRPPAYPAQLEDAQTMDLLSDSFAMLRQIALAADGLRGHKALVWLGRGFPTVDSTDLDGQSNEALRAAMRETVGLLTRDRITLYKVDPITTNDRMAATDLATTLDLGSGMGTFANNMPVNEDPLSGDFNFNQFAVQTGGTYLYGRNDLDAFIAASLDRGAHFYTLSYVPAPSAKPDSFQSIQIKMRDPSLKAVTRSGFYDADSERPEPNATELGFDLQLAASSAVAYNGVAVQVSAVTVSAASKRLTVNFAVADRSLSWAPQESGAESAHVLAVLVALDANRKVQATSASLLNLTAKNARETTAGALATKAQVTIDAKTRFVRLLVRDSSGRIGTAEIAADAWSEHP